MRALRVVGQAVFYLIVPLMGAVGAFICLSELRRAPGKTNLLGGTIPITEHRWPWLLVLIVLLGLAWRLVRGVGGLHGWFWGLLMVGARTVFWGAVAALVLFVGVAIHGLLTHPLADLIWSFTLGYLLVAALALILSCLLQQRLLRSAPVSARD